MWTWLWNWAISRGWKNVEEHDRKSLDCLEQTVSRKLDANNCANEDSEGSEKHSRENINCLRLYLNHHEQIVSRNMGVKGAAVGGSKGNEEHVIGNEESRFWLHSGRKLSRIFPAVMGKAGLVNDEMQHGAEISQ